MTILLVSALMAFALILFGLRRVYSEVFIFFGYIMATAVLFGLLAVLLQNMELRGEIAEYREAQRSITAAREADVSEVERAAILQTTTEWNSWRASWQWWNDSLFDIWIPDEIDDLEPMR